MKTFVIFLLSIALTGYGVEVSWSTFDGGGATFSTAGTVKLGGTLGQPDAGTLSAGSVTLTGGFWSHASFPALQAPSSPTASSNPIVAGKLFTFDNGISGPGLIITWNFGDGSPAMNGNPATHTFTAAGNYTITVTALQPGTGEKIVQTLSVIVNAVQTGSSAPGDADGDGFSDEQESQLGSDPADKNSTPLDNAPAGPVYPLNVTKLRVNVKPAKSNFDSIGVDGTLSIPTGFKPQGARVILDVGGVVRSFLLDANGARKQGNDALKIGIKSKKGVIAAQTAKFSAKFSKGTFAPNFADEGITAETTVKNDTSKVVRVNLYFDGKLFRKDQPQIYSAKAGSSGSTK